VKLIENALTFALLTPGLIAQSASVTTTTGQATTTLTEPAVTDVAGLFHDADLVAVVKVVSGDTEHYTTAAYKAQVVQAFKGTNTGETLYFGPYVGLRLGWQYVVFLRSMHETLKPTSETAISYGPLRYYLIFDEGYTAMETNYECVFHGEDVKQECDDAVRVCTDYVKTPRSLELAPPLDEETPFGCRWSRRQQFLALLQKLSAAKG
jgi:hypothetical protein